MSQRPAQPTPTATAAAPVRVLVRVAVALNEPESARLSAALERYLRAPVTLDVELAPDILGGVWLRMGDTVIDGTLSGRLEALRQHLCAQCRIMVTSGVGLGMPEQTDRWTENP
jgi:hypothetical protein